MIFMKGTSKTTVVSTISMLPLFDIGYSSEKANNNITSRSITATKIENNLTSISENTNTKSTEKYKLNVLAKFNLKEAIVSRVVDGDTLELSDGSKVRLLGVNTPESTTNKEPYGKEASNYTKSQLTSKIVYIQKDISETDKYGRLLRYIWLAIPKEINDSEIRSKMFNAILILNGYAEVSTFPPDVKYQGYFTKYNSEARNANKGLWSINHNGTTKGDVSRSGSQSSRSSMPSSTGHGLIKGNISSIGEKIYHVPGGKFYDKTSAVQWFNTEEEAQSAGYRKSKV